MSIYHDEIEIEDFEFDDEEEMYYYPCPCGDRFEISKVSTNLPQSNWIFSHEEKFGKRAISKLSAIFGVDF